MARVCWYLTAEGRTHHKQDALPSQGTSHPHPHSLRLGHCKHTNSPNMHIFGLWEETEVSRENPCWHGENMPTLQKAVAPAPNQNFFLINVITKHHWTKRRYSRTCRIREYRQLPLSHMKTFKDIFLRWLWDTKTWWAFKGWNREMKRVRGDQRWTWWANLEWTEKQEAKNHREKQSLGLLAPSPPLHLLPLFQTSWVRSLVKDKESGSE